MALICNRYYYPSLHVFVRLLPAYLITRTLADILFSPQAVMLVMENPALIFQQYLFHPAFLISALGAVAWAIWRRAAYNSREVFYTTAVCLALEILVQLYLLKRYFDPLPDIYLHDGSFSLASLSILHHAAIGAVIMLVLARLILPEIQDDD